eukprot:3245692-Prymnesium_polylepis.1
MRTLCDRSTYFSSSPICSRSSMSIERLATVGRQTQTNAAAVRLAATNPRKFVHQEGGAGSCA